MHRVTILLALAFAAFAAFASPALAGQIVYNTEPADGDAQIRVMNDDGSNDRLLVHEDDIPGAESIYKPYVSPDGSTVVFQARTPGPGSGGVFCGFRCSGIYAYSGGTVTRISQDPIDCPPGDLCLGLDVDPRITGGGTHLFYQLIYGEPGGSYGTPQTTTTNYYRTMAPGGGDEVEVPHTSCGEGSSVTPNPAADGQFATSAYCVGTGGMYSLKILDMNGSEQTLGFDDADFSNPAFRGDGEVLVGAEDGGDPGLWLYPRDGSNPRHLAAIAWDSDIRPFDTSPTFVGNDRVAFIHGETIRAIPTSCDACSLDSADVIASATAVDAIAWTSQDIPSPAVQTPVDGGGGNPTPTPAPRPTPAPAPAPVVPAQALVLKSPAKFKLARVLRRGIKVPFTATKTGRLSMRATIAPALAKRLKLVRRASKPVVVARGTTNVTRAGEAVVTLKFTAAAKKRLKRARSVPLKLAGTFAGDAIAGRTRLAR